MAHGPGTATGRSPLNCSNRCREELIRNHPGFPHGVSGDDLAFRTFEQACLFSASFVFAQAATALAARGSERLVSKSAV
jgi:thioredoxin reductase